MCASCPGRELVIFTIIASLPTDLLTYSNVYGLPNSLKNGIRCGRVCTAKSLNSIEYLASEVFSCVASVNSPNIFCLTPVSYTHLRAHETSLHLGLPNSLKNGIQCGRVCTAKSLNSIEYLVSEVFSYVASLNSPNILSLTCNTIYSPFT